MPNDLPLTLLAPTVYGGRLKLVFKACPKIYRIEYAYMGIIFH